MEKSEQIQQYYSDFIHLSRYSRWLEEKNRRETWEETVNRLITFWCKQFKQFDEVELDYLYQIENAILNKEIMPSMRSLMTAGPALERDHIAGYNPVTGDTKVVTKEFGTVPIVFLKDKRATILNKDGRWAEAEFHGYGKQHIYKVTARLNSNTIKEITCTPNHRWITQNNGVVSTINLSLGDRIAFVSAPKPNIDDDYILGIRHGLVYGDGTTAKSCGRVKGYFIRLCGEDNRELLEYFKGYPITYPPSANGDPVVQLYDGFASTHNLKELPSSGETESYLLGFIRGWLAADGSVTKTSQVSLCTANEGLEWLNNNVEKLGFTIQRRYKQKSETNYGKRRQDSWIVYFSRSSMVQEDFLCSWKRNKFKPLESHWVIANVEQLGYEEDVYCAEVEDTNTFVLDGGLVTGNCAYTPITGTGKHLNIFTDEMKDLGFDEPISIQLKNPIAFDEIFYILLCGTGVGFSVERQYIANLPTVDKPLDRSIYRRNNKNYPGVPTHELSYLDKKANTIRVTDSKYGWASALRIIITELFNGNFDIKWDTSKIRPAGAKLKTFGGRASGPRALEELFAFTVELFKTAKGRKLTSYEAHSLVCKIADTVVVGGVRRSALISLSNLSDNRMSHAKSGQWWLENPHFALANNSVAYTEKPDIESFMREWTALMESKAGERGIYNREAVKKQVAGIGRRNPDYEWGVNP